MYFMIIIGISLFVIIELKVYNTRPKNSRRYNIMTLATQYNMNNK